MNMCKEPIYLGEMSVGSEQSLGRRAVWTGGQGFVVLDSLIFTGAWDIEIRATDLKFPDGRESNFLVKRVDDSVDDNWLLFALPPCVINVSVRSQVSSSVSVNVAIFPVQGA